MLVSKFDLGPVYFFFRNLTLESANVKGWSWNLVCTFFGTSTMGLHFHFAALIHALWAWGRRSFSLGPAYFVSRKTTLEHSNIEGSSWNSMWTFFGCSRRYPQLHITVHTHPCCPIGSWVFTLGPAYLFLSGIGHIMDERSEMKMQTYWRGPKRMYIPSFSFIPSHLHSPNSSYKRSNMPALKYTHKVLHISPGWPKLWLVVVFK